jgi:propanol-preferring alcohol dehydrogenase
MIAVARGHGASRGGGSSGATGTMRAWRVERQAPVEERPLKLVEVPSPKPAADELLVKVRACAVCRTDLHVVEGDLPLRGSPTIPGHQVVGDVVDAGAEVRRRSSGGRIGERVGVAWLHRTCGSCRFCTSGRENLCERADFTGWTVPGGFAELVAVPEAFAHPLPRELPAAAVAPLLCAGIVGYRALRLSGVLDAAAAGFKLGLYGFGAAGHLALQVARAHRAQVYVCTRDRERHRALALELGAVWAGGADEPPPQKLDAAVIFAPAGELVPAALRALDKGGRLVLGGIHMSPTPPLPYDLLYFERSIRSVAHNTRQDARDFLADAARAGVRAHFQTFPFAAADQALLSLKRDALRGAAVLVMDAG